MSPRNYSEENSGAVVGYFEYLFSGVSSLNIRMLCDKWLLSGLVDVSITNPVLEYSLPHYSGMKID